MEIKTNRKVEICYKNIKLNKIRSGEKVKTDDYIHSLYTNVYHQYKIACHADRYFYYRGIISSPDNITNCNFSLTR